MRSISKIADPERYTESAFTDSAFIELKSQPGILGKG